ncbi:MAG: DNA recombination protein RmuC [Ignavibacteria bacterium]|jgi:DNA recombination protein RmuC
MLTEIIFLIIGLFIGAIGSFFIAKYRSQSNAGKLEERNSILENEINNIKSELSSERSKVLNLNSELASKNADYNNLQQKLGEQQQNIEELQRKFSVEFENLANKILEEKSKKFTEQNRSNLDDILKPLSERIKEFEKKVNDVYISETKERASLSKELQMLYELNQQMSKDATNLTKALKGDNKVLGNWGEFILESILEKSGLERDREFIIQKSLEGADGSRFRPDVIIKLPEEKSMVIDSKASLTAYDQYCATDDDEKKAQYLGEHINSIKNHIKRLSPKSYQDLYGLNSLDFVLMFIPIEPAFALAVQIDNNIFNEAFERNIVIVSPSTLLATLRTIASIWKQEKQNRNALEIARQCGELYDKFTGFVEDLTAIGNNIKSTQENYDKAMNKLAEGRGNLVRRVENIKQLGAKSTKSLPDSLLNRSEDDAGEEK